MLRQKHNNNEEPAAEPPGAPQAVLEQAPESGVAKDEKQNDNERSNRVTQGQRVICATPSRRAQPPRQTSPHGRRFVRLK